MKQLASVFNLSVLTHDVPSKFHLNQEHNVGIISELCFATEEIEMYEQKCMNNYTLGRSQLKLEKSAVSWSINREIGLF